jgi:FkbM family methyltransferase
MRALRFFRYGVIYCRQLWLLHIVRDARARTVRQWQRDGGDSSLRVTYPLTRASRVFDLGGYQGDWAAAINGSYGCGVYVFEPIPQYCAQIRLRFDKNPAVTVFEFGLAAQSGVETISIAGESSSIHRGGGRQIQIRLEAIGDFLRQHPLEQIDLMKINIEGAEYALLDHMLAVGLAERCVDLQIQFHDFVPDALERRATIRRQLARTHALTYDYPFVWENWRRNDRMSASK